MYSPLSSLTYVVTYHQLSMFQHGLDPDPRVNRFQIEVEHLVDNMYPDPVLFIYIIYIFLLLLFKMEARENL